MKVRVILFASVSFAATSASASAAPPITLIAPDKATVSSSAPKPLTITVRNEEANDLAVRLSVLLDKGSATLAPPTTTVSGHDVKRLKVTISPDQSDRDTVGDLVLKPADAAPAVLPITIEPKKNYNYSAVLAIWFPLAAAVALVLWAVLTTADKKSFGPANWDYSQSWASTLTVVGALLGTVLSAGVLPDELDLFTKAGYAGLNIFFGMLVLFAPLVYAAFQKRLLPDKDGVPQYEGTVRAFAVASVATLWGVFGELVTVGLLFREIEKAGSLPSWLVWALGVVLVVLLLTAVRYAARRMRLLLGATDADGGTGLVAPGVAGTWSLL
jgi:uncharacterized membrane protein YecN with MAPEG domain